MPEPEMLYEASGRCSTGGYYPPLARSRRSNKDETLYNAQNKMAIPQRLPTVKKKNNDDEKNWRFSYASSVDVDDLSTLNPKP